MTPWWDRARHADRRVFLEGRAKIVRAVRAWFEAEGFVEVEPGALAQSPGAEVHVDAFESAEDNGQIRYLHTSPEFAMKKLLAAGETKIFFLGKCWRRGETGPLHAEEFTMLEWYRAHAQYEHVMDDCLTLARLAAHEAGSDVFRWKDRTCNPFAEAQRVTVRDAMGQYAASHLAGEAPTNSAGGGRADAPLSASGNAFDRPPPPAPAPRGGGDSDAHDAFSKAIVRIEPHLGSPALTLLHEYPISEAALAQRCKHNPSVAERFELYACGVELANGFGELTDPVEQRARLEAAMADKTRRYGKRWPIDEDFLAALAHMPPSSGVALGFDRLVMLATGARRIHDVLWTPA